MAQQLERRDPTQEDEDEDEDEEMEEGVEDSDSESEDEDEDEADVEPDLELRSKIEEALRASGIEPADDSEGEGDSEEEEEEVMDDDQMMAIDDKLAEIFRSRASEKKGGKGVYPPPSQKYVCVDSLLLQMQTPNARQLTSKTAFSTLWISTSRNSQPVPTFRSWSHLCSNSSSLPVRKKANCPKRRLVSFVHVSENSRSTRSRTKRLISVLFSRIYTRRLVAHPPRIPSQQSDNVVVIWFEPSAIPARTALFAPCTASPFKTL